MISNLRLKAGRIPDAEGEAFAPTPMTIFVGPNNSGKSKVLSEIEQFCVNGPQATQIVLKNLEFIPFSGATATKAIEDNSASPVIGELVNAGHVIMGNGRVGRIQVPYDHFLMILQNPQANMQPFCNYVVCYLV